MQVKEIMTESPACCTPDTPLQVVAQMMVNHDCGCIPVIENEETGKPVGVVTDRDIVTHTVAEGKNPQELTARDCMSSPVVTVTPDTSVDDCCNTMEENQIRRVPVVDGGGGCCGMVAQADIALNADEHETAEVVQDISRPTRAASDVGTQAR